VRQLISQVCENIETILMDPAGGRQKIGLYKEVDLGIEALTDELVVGKDMSFAAVVQEFPDRYVAQIA
jgi:hypothetical protein